MVTLYFHTWGPWMKGTRSALGPLLNCWWDQTNGYGWKTSAIRSLLLSSQHRVDEILSTWGTGAYPRARNNGQLSCYV